MAPVMNALDYYTKMQQELETEKLRSDEMKPPDAGTATRTGVGAADDAPITTIHKFKVCIFVLFYYVNRTYVNM